MGHPPRRAVFRAGDVQRRHLYGKTVSSFDPTGTRCRSARTPTCRSLAVESMPSQAHEPADFAPPPAGAASTGSITQVTPPRSHTCSPRISRSSAANRCHGVGPQSMGPATIACQPSSSMGTPGQRQFVKRPAWPKPHPSPQQSQPKELPFIAPPKESQEHHRRRDNKKLRTHGITSRITNNLAAATIVASINATTNSRAVEDRRFIPRAGGQNDSRHGTRVPEPCVTPTRQNVQIDGDQHSHEKSDFY
jgi:hypothetical protein